MTKEEEQNQPERRVKGRLRPFEKEARIRYIMDLIGAGLYSSEIVVKASQKWDVHPRGVYRYICIVKKMLTDQIDKQDINDLLTRFDYLYREAVQRRDYKTANAILNNKGKYQIGTKLNIDADVNVSGVDIRIIKKGDNDETKG